MRPGLADEPLITVQVGLGDRLLVADGSGQLGWSPVYLRHHVAQLDTYDYLRLTMADGHQVCMITHYNILSEPRFVDDDLPFAVKFAKACEALVPNRFKLVFTTLVWPDPILNGKPLMQLDISDDHLLHVTATPTTHTAGETFTAATTTPAWEIRVRARAPHACSGQTLPSALLDGQTSRPSVGLCLTHT